jgi:hypothetical protein
VQLKAGPAGQQWIAMLKELGFKRTQAALWMKAYLGSRTLPPAVEETLSQFLCRLKKAEKDKILCKRCQRVGKV